VIKYVSGPVGIDDISVYVPKLFLPTTEEFADSQINRPIKANEGIRDREYEHP
jgi:hypothetical protein